MWLAPFQSFDYVVCVEGSMGRPRGYELDGASRVEIYILKGGRLFLIFYYYNMVNDCG